MLFVIPELTGGGAERILLDIMKNLDRARFEIRLVLFQRSGTFLDEVPEDVSVYDLKESRHYRVAGLFRIIHKLYRIITSSDPDLVFSVINVANFLAIPAAGLAGVRVIAYEVSNPSMDIWQEFKYPTISMSLLKMTYPSADVILALSLGIKDLLLSHCRIRPRRIEVAYTPFDIKHILEKAMEDVEHAWFHEDIPIIMGIGALVKRKGFHVLIEALAEVRKKLGARLMIIGEGEMREELYRLAASLDLSDNVFLAGFDKNPWKYLRYASVFVLSSDHEGFGNVIVEAMICGVPVVSTDCPVGPREILKDGECGLLVRPGNPQEMAEALKKLLEDNELRHRFIKSGHERSKDFEKSGIMRRLVDVIESTLDLRS